MRNLCCAACTEAGWWRELGEPQCVASRGAFGRYGGAGGVALPSPAARFAIARFHTAILGERAIRLRECAKAKAARAVGAAGADTFPTAADRRTWQSSLWRAD